MNEVQPAFATDKDAATYLNVSINTVQRMRNSGELPAVKLGKRAVRIPWDAIKQLGQPFHPMHQAVQA